jgi:AcrR family transcriptional regulator
VFIEMKKRKRPYVQRVRGDHVAETRARIVEAIMQLHQEIGPRNTTVSAIAARAGVERLTVYRHFKDEAAMFAACSLRYLELNPPPEPTDWASEPDSARRTRRALETLYAFFSRTSTMFEKIYRDVSESVALHKVMSNFDGYLRGLADDLAAAWPHDQRASHRRTILRHAAKFATWQSFEAEGVADAEKAALILHWLSSPLR